MIESALAVDNADEIAAVAGMDVLLIGTFDLSAERGIAGQVTIPGGGWRTPRGGGVPHARQGARHGRINEPRTCALPRHGRALSGAGSDQSYIAAGAAARMALLQELLASRARPAS